MPPCTTSTAWRTESCWSPPRVSGLGFGLTVPALNTFTAAFNPTKVDGSVLVLNALLGLGTALAPVFVAIFVGLGFWWGLPVGVAVALAAILAVSIRLPLHVGPRGRRGAERHALPSRFWIYAAFAVGYGICETMNGNWATLDMKSLGASTTMASLALTAFWGSVTIGRVLFAAIQRWLPTQRTYRAACRLCWQSRSSLIALLPDDEPALGILAFGIAGFGCSALLPLTISFGQGELVTMSASFAGAAIAFYQIGYGIAAFGVGPIEDSGVELSTVYGFAALIAAALVACSRSSSSAASALRALRLLHVDAAAAERVDAAPPTGDVEQLDAADAAGQDGIDHQMVADRFQPEHRSQEQQRRARRPRLRAARRRVLHGVLRLRTRVAAERLRESAVEYLGRVEHSCGDRARLPP